MPRAMWRGAIQFGLVTIPVKLLRLFDADCRRAGIPKRDQRGRTVDLHALRTTFGTHLARAGVPLSTAQKLMRHKDPKLTAKGPIASCS